MVWLNDGSVVPASGLDPVAVHTRSRRCREVTLPRPFSAIVIDVLEIEGVYMAGDISIMRRHGVSKRFGESIQLLGTMRLPKECEANVD